MMHTPLWLTKFRGGGVREVANKRLFINNKNAYITFNVKKIVSGVKIKRESIQFKIYIDRFILCI